MNILDLISTVGIIVSVYLVVFTSEQLVKITDYPAETMYIVAYVVMHLIFALKYILSVLIEDTPEWVEEDIESEKHRVNQILNDN